MKWKWLSIMLVLCLGISSAAGAEGLLPSLADAFGVSMPSLGEALQRYPDSEIESTDGSSTEVYVNVSEKDFNTFSVYLGAQNAVLETYKAEGNVFRATLRLEHKTIDFTYDLFAQEARVTYPQGTYDGWLEKAKTGCRTVKALLEERKIDEAAKEMRRIPACQGYAPFAALLAENADLAEALLKAQKYLEVGSYISFGTYPQTESGNDATPIEWLVLDYDEDNNRALLLSRYGLDAKPYNDEWTDITWEKCTLRTWLNGTFLHNAFTAQEQAGILQTNVDNSKSQGYSGWITSGGNDTQDKLFLLSYAEVYKYLGIMYNGVIPTSYAIEQGAHINSSNNNTASGMWWLRSPGRGHFYATYVSQLGNLNDTKVNNIATCVRPAMWIDLDSGIF